MRDQQARHQAVDLIVGQRHVAERVSDQAREHQCHARRDWNHERGAAERAGNRANQIPESEDLRPDGVDDAVFAAWRAADRERGEVVDKHGLNAIIAATRDRKDRKTADEPGDVVNQDVFGAEDKRRPQDRI